jgi:hypothetical protein
LGFYRKGFLTSDLLSEGLQYFFLCFTIYAMMAI